jgi:hypothetical protein
MSAAVMTIPDPPGRDERVPDELPEQAASRSSRTKQKGRMVNWFMRIP